MPFVAPTANKILVIGGEGNGRAYDTVEALDPITNTWETLGSLNHRRHGTQAIASGEGVYIVAGSPNQGVFVNQVTLSGDDAEDFVISSPVSDPHLILTGSHRDLFVEYAGISDGASAWLDITYSGTQTIQVALKGTPVPKPNSSIRCFIATALGLVCLDRRRHRIVGDLCLIETRHRIGNY